MGSTSNVTVDDPTLAEDARVGFPPVVGEPERWELTRISGSGLLVSKGWHRARILESSTDDLSGLVLLWLGLAAATSARSVASAIESSNPRLQLRKRE